MFMPKVDKNKILKFLLNSLISLLAATCFKSQLSVCKPESQTEPDI